MKMKNKTKINEQKCQIKYNSHDKIQCYFTTRLFRTITPDASDGRTFCSTTHDVDTMVDRKYKKLEYMRHGCEYHLPSCKTGQQVG